VTPRRAGAANRQVPSLQEEKGYADRARRSPSRLPCDGRPAATCDVSSAGSRIRIVVTSRRCEVLPISMMTLPSGMSVRAYRSDRPSRCLRGRIGRTTSRTITDGECRPLNDSNYYSLPLSRGLVYPTSCALPLRVGNTTMHRSLPCTSVRPRGGSPDLPSLRPTHESARRHHGSPTGDENPSPSPQDRKATAKP
jgi:hypothetical protein